MDLNDLMPMASSKQLANISKKTFGTAIDFSQLTENKAKNYVKLFSL